MSDQPADLYAGPQHTLVLEGVLVMSQTAFAQRRGVRASYIRNLVGKRRIPRQLVVTIGGRRMLKVEALERWLDSQRLAMNGRTPAEPEPPPAPPAAATSPFFARMAQIEARQGDLIDLLQALHSRLDEWMALGIGPALVERVTLLEGELDGEAPPEGELDFEAIVNRRCAELVAVIDARLPAGFEHLRMGPEASVPVPPPAGEVEVEHARHLDRPAEDGPLCPEENQSSSTTVAGWVLEQILFNKPSGRFWTGHDGLEPRWSEDPAEARTFRTEALAEDARRFHKLTSWRAVELASETAHG